MRSSILQPLLLRGVAFQPFSFKSSASSYSTLNSVSVLAEKLYNDLTSRKLPIVHDYLHPQPSHLLNLTLADLLPSNNEQKHFQTESQSRILPALPSISRPSPLPLAHHLIYFPPQVSLSQLLPDGTDILHTPGDPFNRRLWAGGNIRFSGHGPLLDGSRAVCIESIRNVVVKGREGEEKVIVTIERRVGVAPEEESEEESYRRIWMEDESQFGDASVVENRDLIFMRVKSAEEIRSDQRLFGEPSRIVKSPSNATFRHSILPTKALLFRFSALTFNAHSIHLDREYTQNQEGYRNCLVHGPLTLTLILSVLQGHLQTLNLRVAQFEYRNLAPLFVDEKLTICGKPKNGGSSWDVWIEGPDGGLAVRGTAKTCDLA
ncbi:hypothetical protein PENSTE_c001G06268 [Penicillium steckii]|uniref:MaoC-like domain-containing protein n=1 Tax=Penicillium steckii TaxID=303698 RepID=A0A1V6TZM4_9EURO|nr:hypothetical protein PENSTE_c001G06268 [Penicillium steckii]